jgi:hypothetical protein
MTQGKYTPDRSEIGQGVAGALAAGGVAAFSAVVSGASEATWKIVIALAIIAVAGFFFAASLGRAHMTTKLWSLRAVCASMVVLAALLFFEFRSEGHSPIIAEYTVDGSDETQVLRGSGEPAGPPAVLDAPQLASSHTYSFSCKVVLRSHKTQEIWLKLAGYSFWYPLAGLHAPPGTDPPELPTCDA